MVSTCLVPRPPPAVRPVPRGPNPRALEDLRLFAALGRFTVRFRWLIIAGWIVATVVLVTCLPALSSVEKSSNSEFLPVSAASVQAGTLAAPFGSTTHSDVTYVAVATTGSLTAADNAAIARAEQAIRSIPRVA